MRQEKLESKYLLPMTQPKEPLESIVEFGMGVTLNDIAFNIAHNSDCDFDAILEFIIQLNEYVGDWGFTRKLSKRLNEMIAAAELKDLEDED